MNKACIVHVEVCRVHSCGYSSHCSSDIAVREDLIWR
jgi:hypothetical protein